MRLIVNGILYTDFSTPIAVSAGQDLTIQWDPISAVAGFGREGIGYELGGIGGTRPPDIDYVAVEIVDPATDDVVATSDPVRWPDAELVYTAAMNEADHGSVFATDMIIRAVQFDHAGRRRVLGEIETT